MVFRTLVWLSAVGALVAVLALDRAPADPVRRTGPANTAGASTTLVLSWSQIEPVTPVTSERDRPDDVQQPTPWLLAYTGAPEQARALAGLVRDLASAADRSLEEPTPFEINVMAPQRGLLGKHFARVRKPRPPLSCVYPAGSAPFTEFCHELWHQQHTLPTDGAILLTGSSDGHDRMIITWHACHKGRWKARWLLPTHALNPDEDRRRAEVLRYYVGTFDSNVAMHAASQGLLLAGSNLEAVEQLLSDPQLIRLARELSSAPPAARSTARRAALADDDPRLGEFAAVDQLMLYGRGKGISQAAPPPLELLQGWPHPDRARASLDADPQGRWFQELPPEIGAREIQRLARTTVNADQLAEVFSGLLSAKSPVPRRAAQAAFLDRLPVGALAHLDHYVLPLTWTRQERDCFYDALLTRLRTEFAGGDVERAARVLGEAIALNDDWNVTEDYVVWSRCLGLAAQLLFDEAVGAAIRRHGGDAVASIAGELLHSSDPEMRRRACQLLKANNEPLPRALAGDPYLEDLLPR